MGRWTYPYARRDARRNIRRRRYSLATLATVNDRTGTARLDDGPVVDVNVPNGMWVWAGNRVALYRYPDGWTVVAGVRPNPQPAARGTR